MRGLAKFFLLGLFLLLQSTNAMATEFIDEISIYVYGDVGYIESSLNSLAMVFGSDAFGSMVDVGALIFMSYSAYSWMKNQSLSLSLGDAAMYAAIAILLVNTNATITVKVFDKRADHGMMNYVDNSGNPIPTFAAVANVPYAIGIIAGVSSYLRYSLIEVSDTAFATIADTSYAKIGFMQNFQVMRDIVKNADFQNHPETQAYSREMSSYIETCILDTIATSDPNIVDKMKNPPNGALIDYINPANVGINSGMTITYGTLGEMTCENFYNTRLANVSQTIANTLFAGIKSSARPINPEAISSSLVDTFRAQTTSALIGGASGLEAYLFNVASSDALGKALTKNQMGLDLSSTNAVNAIAGLSATRGMQVSGIGQLEWLSSILPHAIHFILGIIYSVGIFPLLMSMVMRSPFMVMLYAKGLLSIELVSYGLSVVHNASTYFAQHDAGNKLAYLETNQNAGSMQYIVPQLDYIATMSGVAGVIGVAVAFGLPMFIMKGDISGMMSGLGGLASRFNNNLNAIGEILNKQLDKEMVNRQEGANPTGLQDQIYAAKVKAGMDRSAQAYAAIVASSDSNRSDYAKGATSNAVNQAGNTTGTGRSGVTHSEAFDSGIVSGKTAGINMQETSKMANNNDYFDGVRGNTAMGLGQTAGTGKEMRKLGMKSNDMSSLGSKKGAESLASDVMSMDGKTEAGVFNSDGTASDEFMHATKVSSAKKAKSLIDYGNRVDMKTALDAGSAEGAQMAGGDIGSAVGLKKYGEDGLANASKNMAATKTASMMGASKEIDSRGLNNAMNLTSNAAEAKQAGDFTTTTRQNEMFKAQGGARGAAVMNANKGVDDNHASFSGEIGAGKRSSNGTLTGDGYAGVMQKIGEAAKMEMFAAANMGTTASSSQNSAIKEKLKTDLAQMIKADSWANEHLSKEEKEQAAESYANSVMKDTGLTDKNGKAISGFNRAMAFAKMKAGNTFGVSKGTMSNGTSISLNTGGADGNGVRVSLDSGTMVSSGDSTSLDESHTINQVNKHYKGNDLKAGVGAANNMKDQEARELSEHMLNPLQKGIPALIGKTYSETSRWLQEQGVSMDAADAMAGAAVGTAGAVTAAGIVELGQMTKNYAQGNYIDNTTGQKVNINSPQGRAAYEANPKGFSVEGGTPSKFVRSLFNMGDSHFGGESPINPTDGSGDIRHNTENHHPHAGGEGKPNNVTHPEPPLNNLHNSSTNAPHIQGNLSAEPPIGHNPKTGGAKGMILGTIAAVGLSQYSAQAAEVVETGLGVMDTFSGVAGQVFNPTKLGEGSDTFKSFTNTPNAQPSPVATLGKSIDANKLEEQNKQMSTQNSLRQLENESRQGLEVIDAMKADQDKMKEAVEKSKKQKPIIVFQQE